MKLETHEWQLVSLELAKKMKELEFKQESLWWWVKNYLGEFILCYKCPNRFISREGKNVALHDSFEVYSAYTVAELGEMLPNRHAVRIYKSSVFSKEESWCFVDYYNVENIIRADTEANARAKMLIYLKEKGLLK